jgi:hypothetical protein
MPSQFDISVSNQWMSQRPFGFENKFSIRFNLKEKEDTMGLVLVCVFWFFCALLSGGIAEMRGLDFLKFFLIGLVFGVIGIVAALIANPPPNSSSSA